MAQRKTKKITEEQRVVRMLKSRGFKPISDKEKREPWYPQYLKQLEQWRENEVHKPLAVHEKLGSYTPSKNRKKTSNS